MRFVHQIERSVQRQSSRLQSCLAYSSYSVAHYLQGLIDNIEEHREGKVTSENSGGFWQTVHLEKSLKEFFQCLPEEEREKPSLKKIYDWANDLDYILVHGNLNDDKTLRRAKELAMALDLNLRRFLYNEHL